MVSERIRKIREISENYDEFLKYIKVQEAVYTPDPAKSAKIRHAEAFCAVMDQMNTNYIPGSLIAGNGGDKFISRPVHLLESDFEKMRNFPKDTPQQTLDAMREEMFYIWPFTDGHISPGFEKLVKNGIDELLSRIDARAQDESLNDSQKEFLTCAKMQWEAVRRLEMRYADFFKKMADEETDPAKKEEYQTISDHIRRVPAGPATTFREALQSFYFLHMCTQFDDVSNHSMGRVDQYLYPYYKHDIDNGIITKEQAEDLWNEFWLKFSPGYNKSRLEGVRSEGQGFRKDNIPEDGVTWMTLKVISHIKHLDDGQTMDIGGYDENGEDGVNDVSWFALNALKEFRTFEPKPVIKKTPKTDPKFMDQAYELLASGLSHPAITFHDNGAKGMNSYGYFDPKDVHNYCHIGCAELGIAGKAYTDPMNGFVNIAKTVLVTMNGGYMNGMLIGLKQEPAKTYEEFENNFMAQLNHFIDLYVNETNRANPFYAQLFTRPLISATIDGCLEKAQFVDEGGSKYWVKSVECCGIATAADSLMAIKKVVFEDKTKTMDEFKAILEKDFEGEEVFRTYLEKKLPKFGNGDDEVDGILDRIAEDFCNYVKTKRTYVGTIYRPGIYSFYETITRMGRITGATPNGRHAGITLSLNAAPDHGVIQNGLTQTLKSITSWDHTMSDNACPMDLQLSAGIPAEVIKYIMEYLEKHGALYVQTTVANREDMLKAEKTPEKYKDLIVRVTGFSAQYISLDPITRQEILARSYWG